MKLENVVPWGRSKAEYVGMFDLSLQDLSGRILDCAGGPASFNAEATQKGYNVVSCDPIYLFTAEEIVCFLLPGSIHSRQSHHGQLDL